MERETLEAGPSRPPLLPPVPAAWRRRAVAPVFFVLGVAAGAGTALGWPSDGEEQATPRTPPDTHDVELVLVEAAPRPEELVVAGGILLSGTSTAVVVRVEAPTPGIEVRVAALPVTVTPTDRYAPVRLRIRVRDCASAARWEPSDRPFTITWKDEQGRGHIDRAGDFGEATRSALRGFLVGACAGGEFR